MTSPADPQPVIPYASGAEPNRDATAALVWGILGVFPVVLPGVLAIRYGRSGARRSHATGTGGGKARAGVALGIVGLVWSVAFLVSLPTAILHARQKADAVACASNLRTIGMGCMMYAAANGGWLPPNLAALATVGITPGACRAAARSSTPAPPYVLALSSVRLPTIKSASTTVLAYEPLTNHAGRGINVLFADGHVAWFPAASAAPFLASMMPPAPATAPSAR